MGVHRVWMFQWYFWQRGKIYTLGSKVPTWWLYIDLQKDPVWFPKNQYTWMIRIGQIGWKWQPLVLEKWGWLMLLVFSYFIIYLSNYLYLSLQILFRWFLISKSGGPSSHMIASIITWMSLMPLKFFQRRGSRLVRRRLVQSLSIKSRINYRKISTRLKQGSSWWEL